MKRCINLLFCFVVFVSSFVNAYADDDASLRISLANQILQKSSIVLSTTNKAPHYQGIKDGADAKQNIIDTAAGKAAKRSSYADTEDGLTTPAPGGSVYLSVNMLRAILDLEKRFGSLTITAIAGSL